MRGDIGTVSIVQLQYNIRSFYFARFIHDFCGDDNPVFFYPDDPAVVLTDIGSHRKDMTFAGMIFNKGFVAIRGSNDSDQFQAVEVEFFQR